LTKKWYDIESKYMQKLSKKLKNILAAKVNNIFFGIVVFLFALKLISLCFVYVSPNNVFFADVSRYTLINLTNQTRANSGLSGLKEDWRLNQAANLKARDILAYDYFAHTSPSGKTPWYWLDRAGYNYQTAGENLAIDFLDSGELFSAWYASPAHRDNIVNSKFKDIGIAVVTGEFEGKRTTVVVQFFGTQFNVPTALAKETKKPASLSSAPVISQKSTIQPKTYNYQNYSYNYSRLPANNGLTLWSYYQSKGRPFPSHQQRALLYQKFGLGTANSYTGTATQNILLLSKILAADKKEASASKKINKAVVKKTETKIVRLKRTQEQPKENVDLPNKENLSPMFSGKWIKTNIVEKDPLEFKILKFMALNYDTMAKIFFGAIFIVIILSIFVDILIKNTLHPNQLLLRGSIYSFILFSLFLMDKSLILQSIPHSLHIV
jgi:hypothetical protein